MRFCWQQHVVYCVPKTPIPSPRFVLSTTLSPSLRSCSRLLFPRGTPVTCKEKSLPCRRIAAKTPHRQIPDPTPAPVQNPALPRDRQQNQYAYQFAHEFCHVLSGYEGLEGNPNNWFHETICELASVFTLRRMAERWPTHPPYPNWAGYSKHLLEYAAKRQKREEVQLPIGTTLLDWLSSHESGLRNDRYQRDKNDLVACWMERHP